MSLAPTASLVYVHGVDAALMEDSGKLALDFVSIGVLRSQSEYGPGKL